MLNIPDGAKRIYISTGNILNLNEIKKKAGQDPADELLEVLKLVSERDTYKVGEDDGEFVLKSHLEKLDYPSNELLTSIKIFINNDQPKTALKQALYKVLGEMELSPNDSVVLAYDGADENLNQVSDTWAILEEEAKEKLLRIGLADMDTQHFIDLYNSVKVKPSIVQVNLATCCVVPPALQQFAKEKEIQLLTHSDPAGLLSEASLSEDGKKVSLCWAVRYQVHVKCRGVLASKGYLLSLQVE